METLKTRLESLEDHRTRKGRRYSLPSLVMLALAAMLSGANDLLGIHRFGRRLTPKSLEMLGISHGKSPAHATLHYVFGKLDAARLAQALMGPCAPGLGHVAVDGKRLRGSAQDGRPGVHVLSAFATELSQSIGALTVPPDSGEMVEALRLIRDLPVGPGDVISGDAAFTQRSVVEEIRAKGADYFLFVKGNQGELKREIAEKFGDFSP